MWLAISLARTHTTLHFDTFPCIFCYSVYGCVELHGVRSTSRENRFQVSNWEVSSHQGGRDWQTCSSRKSITTGKQVAHACKRWGEGHCGSCCSGAKEQRSSGVVSTALSGYGTFFSKLQLRNTMERKHTRVNLQYHACRDSRLGLQRMNWIFMLFFNNMCKGK